MKRYIVTKEFTGGILKGIVIEQETSVRFREGFRCDNPFGGSPYIITAVREVAQ